MWHFLFTDREPENYRDILASDNKKLIRFDVELIRQGIFVLPGNRRFVSIAHTDRDLADTSNGVRSRVPRIQGRLKHAGCGRSPLRGRPRCRRDVHRSHDLRSCHGGDKRVQGAVQPPAPDEAVRAALDKSGSRASRSR